MTGGASVTGNTAGGYGGGVNNEGTFSISGGAQITGNTVGEAAGNVYLFTDKTVTVTGELTGTDPIGVTMDDPGVFTSGWSTYMSGEDPADYFISTNADLAVVLDDSGEAALYAPAFYTVSFDTNGGSDAPDDQTIVEGGKAEKPEDPTREGFGFGGWYPLTDPDTEAFADTPWDFVSEVTEDVTLIARWLSSYTAAVYSRTEGSPASVADVSLSPEADSYAEGDSVTAIAPNKSGEGYSFQGWYEVTEVTDSLVTHYGDLVSCNLSYTFSITENTRLVAVYEPRGDATVTVSVVNGAKYYTDKDSTIKTGGQEKRALGSTLTLYASDADKVLQWQNERGKVLGRGGSLSIPVTGDMEIKLHYNTPESDSQSILQFVNDYGQVLLFNQLSGTSPKVDFPDCPSKFGYLFDKWVFEGTEEEAAEDAIRTKLGTEPVIIVKPIYTKDATVYTVTVAYEGADGRTPETLSGLAVGTNQPFTAPEIPGFSFLCWKSGDTVLSYNSSYTLKVNRDETLTACYAQGAGAVAQQPAITLSEPFTVSGSVHKVSCIATRDVRGGYELIEQGMLYAKGVEGLTEDTFKEGQEGVQIYRATEKTPQGFLTVNIKIVEPMTDDTLISFRGYMILQENSTGNQVVFYSGIAAGSYNSING